jgi:choline dehydrogenase-like flavoprotein
MNEHSDVIIIGTGRAGDVAALAALAQAYPRAGTRAVSPREQENWSYKGSFKYYSSEKMFNKDGGAIYPGFSYHVGGNTKVYGAALFRLREKDFESFRHRDGISPEWPIKYRDWEKYYTQAEEFFQVHGKAAKTH